jgi:hypothetical protein
MTAHSPSFDDGDGQPKCSGNAFVPCDCTSEVVYYSENNLLDGFNEIKSIVLPNNLSR